MLKPYDLSGVEAIVFDIGNVLIDIDYPKTIESFQALSTLDFKTILSYHQQIAIFNQYEKGAVTTNEFIAVLRQYLREDATDEQIISAWNSMLVGYPEQKINLLHILRKRGYRLYALSNINELHIQELDKNIKQLYGITEFRSLFDKAYYSNEIGWRKPETEFYEFVLSDIGLRADKLLFIDDKAENITPAKALNFQTQHLLKPTDLLSLIPLE